MEKTVKKAEERHYSVAMAAKVSRAGNLRLAQAIQEELENRQFRDELGHLGKGAGELQPIPLGLARGKKLVSDVRWCGKSALFAQHTDGGLRLVTEHVCRNKFCLRCNAIRKNLIRAKYLAFFKNNEAVRVNHDFFHLTLTVPHTEEGWAGAEVYGDLLLKAFNTMRREKWWKSSVYAGEYTVEHTRPESGNGWHVHLHVLVVARRYMQNRNDLFHRILLAWNKLTINTKGKRQAFSPIHIQGLQKSLGFLEPEIADRVIDQLSPRGSTLVGLESLYYYNGKKKIHSKPEKMQSFLRGILECLKYHFEPVAFKNEDGNFNAGLILDASDLLYKKRLYGKFGAFYGLAELNLSERLEDILIEHLEETLEDGTIESYVIGKPSQITEKSGAQGKDYRNLYLRPPIRELRVESYHDALNEFKISLINKQKSP